jgi:hypothetical protein
MSTCRHCLLALSVVAAAGFVASCAEPSGPVSSGPPFNVIPRFDSVLDTTKQASLQRRLRLLDDAGLQPRPNPGFCRALLAGLRDGRDAAVLEPVREAGTLEAVANSADLPCPQTRLGEEPGAFHFGGPEEVKPERFVLYRQDPASDGSPRYVLMGSKLSFAPIDTTKFSATESSAKLNYRLTYVKLLSREGGACRAVQSRLVINTSGTGRVEPLALFLVKYDGRFYPSIFSKRWETPAAADSFVLTGLSVINEDSPNLQGGCEFVWR